MLTSEEIKNMPLDNVRECIASAIVGGVTKAGLPDACAKLGLESCNYDLERCAKNTYVKARLQNLDRTGLIRVAKEVLKEYGNIELMDLISELTTHAEHRISEITRKKLLFVLRVPNKKTE